MAKILQFPLKQKQQSIENEAKGAGSAESDSKGVDNEFANFIDQMQGKSLEEVNQKMASFQDKKNASVQDDFLGLSPNQMQNLLYSPFKNGTFLTIQGGNTAQFEKVPLMQEALFILQEIGKSKGLKLTQTGKLPRALVKDFWTQFVKSEVERWEPNKEDDCRQILYCRAVLEGAGFLKKEKNKILITKKGAKQLAAGATADFYHDLFSAVFNNWNWAYGDAYDDLQIIQMAGLFNLYALSRVVDDGFFSGTTMSQLFLKAFPNAVREISRSWSSPDEQVRKCFELRFLERICIPLGILTKKDFGTISAKFQNTYKVTEFFRQQFVF